MEVHDSDADMQAFNTRSRIPGDLLACHTATVGGYIVAGHVPADDLLRLLKEKPAIAGLSVAGMPVGAPGMEQGGTKQPYNTVAFTADGTRFVFARH